jgi:tRNA-dependent cyclodipeptide synthase
MNDILERVQELLDKAGIRYISIRHSKAYSEEEIRVNDYHVGNELVDSVLIKMNNETVAMVIVPATRKLSLLSLQKELNNSNISFIGKKEIAKLFPHYEAGTLPPVGQMYDMPVFYLAELLKMPEITFYLGTRTHRIQLKNKDFFKFIAPQTIIHAITTPRYHAEIHTLSPLNEKKQLQTYQSCILGVSLENKNFSTAKLVGMVDWVCRHFENCVVIIGDSIHHYTLEIKGIDEHYAYDKALRLGREAIDTNNPVFQSYAEHCNLKVVLCSQMQETAAYRHYLAQLDALFVMDKTFAVNLSAFADTFVERRAELDEESYRQSIHKSCRYLLEELAIFACLSDEGYQVFVYPGALNILTEISAGFYPMAPAALKNLINVDLKIKRCGAS